MSNRPNIETTRKRAAPRYWVEKKGRLYARLQYVDDRGKAREKYEPITDKRTARTTVEKMRREIEMYGAEVVDAAKMTFNQLADRYVEVELVPATIQNGIKIKGRKSIASLRSSIKPLRKYFGEMRISAIKLASIKKYKNERIDTPIEREITQKIRTLNPATGRFKNFVTKVRKFEQRKIASVNRELAALRAILNFAVANDMLVANPFSKEKGVISTAAEAERDRILSFAEERDFLSVCVGERAHLYPLVVCALDTAMRRGEMFKLRWADLNFETGKIVIRQTNTKTEKTRTVGLTARLRACLWELWLAGPRDIDGRVFGITSTVKKAWSTACRLANIEDFRLHDCRHTGTTRMIASGAPHIEVMKITGHTQLKTFLRYLTITQGTASRVANGLSDYLGTHQTAVEEKSAFIN